MGYETATIDLNATSWSAIPEGFAAMTIQLVDDHVVVLFCIAPGDQTPAIGDFEGLFAPGHFDLTTIRPGHALYLRAQAGVGRVRLLLHDADEAVPMHRASPFTASPDGDRPAGSFTFRT